MPKQKKQPAKINTVDWTAEYFYAESLREMNAFRMESGLPVVSTTQARKLHQEYMTAFHEAIAPGRATYEAMYGANAPKDPERRRSRIGGQMVAAMGFAFSAVMREVNGGRDYYHLRRQDKEAGIVNGLDTENQSYSLGYEASRDRAKAIVSHFIAQTGWELDMAEAYVTEEAEILGKSDARVPLSPYDERFAMRHAMLENGGRILWADANKMISGDVTLMEQPETRLYLEGDTEDGQPNGRFTYRCFYQHPDDVSGLSILRPYMTAKEYKSVQPTIIRDKVTFSPQALEKAAAILEWLTDHGYSYTISNDTNRGQLKARVGNSRLDIRILDIGNNEKYIGRCYEEGYETYYVTNSHTNFVPTTDDILNMISYTLGNPVERSSYNAGEISQVEERTRYGVQVNRQLGVKRLQDKVGRYAGEQGEVFWRMAKTKTGSSYAVTMHQDGLHEYDATGKGTYPNSQVLMDVRLGENKGKYAAREYAIMAIRSRHHASHEYFDTPDQARAFLEDAIQTASANYAEKLDIERLIQEAELHQGEPDYVPELSYDPEIAPIQLQYWEVLSGKRELYKAGMTREEVYQDILDEEDSSEGVDMLLNAMFGDTANGQYEGSPADQVRQHVADMLVLEFGSLDVNPEDGLRFHPSNVARFMTSSYGQFRNIDNVVEALRTLDVPAEELRGNEFQVNKIKDELVKFNPETARVMGGEDDSPFMKSLAKTIQETISTSHCVVNPEDIQIDDNGIVHYTAQRMIISQNGGESRLEPVEGYIGQIFEPDMDGVVETRFNGSPNQLFSPGYLAYVLPQADGESKTLPERVRLKGYLQVLQQNIRRQVRSDLLDPHATVGAPTNVNNSYRGLYENRYKIHGEIQPGETLKEAYLRECQMTGLPEDAVKARFETFRGMIRLPSSFKDDSSLNAAFEHSRDSEVVVEDVMNDSARDAWQLSGGENISVLSEDWDGYTDKTATGSAKNQGVVRYLVQGAHVDENGVMHPARKADGSIDTDARTALMDLKYMRYVDHTPFDRQQMVFSNLSGASAIDEKTGVATLTMGGYTFDDGAVISAKWAEKNGPIGEDGARRPIGVGDKILDCAGNKSIVGKVVDPDFYAEYPEEFEKLSEMDKQIVLFFNDNDKVDVVMSPYSPMSRFNATSARFAMNDNFEIQLPNGETTYGGYMPMIVTDKTVDEKTKEYDDDAVKAGGGRSASGQFNWILSAVGAYGLMDECYGNNESSLANYREYLITMGMDMDATGQFLMGYHPQGEEQRHYFNLPESIKIPELTRRSASDMFRGAVDNRGGFLEIPVQLTFPSGEKLQPVPPEKSAYVQEGIQTYALPIMSSYLRCGQELQDGTSMTHDYTNHYAQIYAASVEYLAMLNSTFKFDPKAVDSEKKPIPEDVQRQRFEKAREKALQRCEARMASEYHEITSDVEARIFTGKHNFVRDHLMSARLPHSATAVWTAEPACDIDEVRMPSSMAKTLGKKEGESVLMWRDPCLHRKNLTGMRVVIDDSLTGVAVNPLIASRMDGDFDGDSVGLYGVSSKAGLKDLNDKLALHNTLLDWTHRDPETGNYALFINTKMDVKSLYARDEEARAKAAAEGHPMEGPSLKERFDALEVRANDIEQGRGEYAGLTPEEKDAANRALCKDVSKWTHDVFESYPIGAQTLSMESPAAYLQDLQRMADTKAKGKAANIADVAKYFGMTYEKTADGTIDYASIEVKDHTLATRQDMKDTEYAVAVKANGTPFGGQFSLNGAEIGRNLCLGDLLDLTYNATQAALQAKHDPVMAAQQYGMLQGALKSMWRGRKLESHMEPVWEDRLDDTGKRIPVLNEDGTQKHKKVWTEVREDGKPVRLTTKQWVEQFMEVHESPDGMNLAGDVNREQVELVAKALTSEDGLVVSIEDERVREAYAAPLDRLAYQPSLEATIEAAKANVFLFEGTANEHLAPKVVRDNFMKMRAFEADGPEASAEAPELKSFGKSDVVDGPVRKESAYQTSERYVGENRGGIGSVVTGKYHAPEDTGMPKEEREAMEAAMRQETPWRFESQETLADMYDSATPDMDEQMISDMALAAQDRDDDEDDIDDLNGTEPVDVSGGRPSGSSPVADQLATKAAEESHDSVSETKSPLTDDRSIEDRVFSTGEQAMEAAKKMAPGSQNPSVH